MSQVCFHLCIAGVSPELEQGFDDFAVFFRGEKPVGGEPNREDPGTYILKSFCQVIFLPIEVEGVECFGEMEVCVGIKAVDKAASLVAKVAFNLELHVREITGLLFAVAAELAFEPAV